MNTDKAAGIALDVHAHLVPVDAPALEGIGGVDWDAARGMLVVDGHTVGVKALYDPQGLVRWMDMHGIGRAWISAPPPLYRPHLDPIASATWTRYINVGLRNLAAGYPGRLAPLFHLPLEHPEVAAAAAVACVAEGATCFSAPAGGYSTPTFSDAALLPLWEALDRVSAFLFLHPGQCCDGRLSAFYLENLLGNPCETTVAAAHLVFGGVAERFSSIRFCLAHAGGATAMLAGRWQRGWDTERPGVDRQREAPRNALRRFYVDSIAHDQDALALAAIVFGEEHILFGSDWPFPMGLPDPGVQLAAVSPPLRRKILTGNALPLLEGQGPA